MATKHQNSGPTTFIACYPIPQFNAKCHRKQSNSFGDLVRETDPPVMRSLFSYLQRIHKISETFLKR
jgi:hypothetical protein